MDCEPQVEASVTTEGLTGIEYGLLFLVLILLFVCAIIWYRMRKSCNKEIKDVVAENPQKNEELEGAAPSSFISSV